MEKLMAIHTGVCNMYEFMELRRAVEDVMGDTMVTFDGWQPWYQGPVRKRDEIEKAITMITVKTDRLDFEIMTVLDHYGVTFQGFGS